MVLLMRLGVCLGLGCLVLGAPASLPPLGGSVHDNNHDVEWHSTATDSSGWRLEYVLQNQRKNRVRTVWRDPAGGFIYNGWLEYSSEPVVRGTVELGAIRPDTWPSGSRIDIDTLIRNTGLYQPPTVAARRVSATSVLSLLLAGIIRQISAKVSSEYSNNTIRYALSLERTEWSKGLQFSWQAADSSAFRNAFSSSTRGTPLFHLDSTMQLEIRTSREPRIRNGALVVWDEQGLFLGAATAPALVE